MGVRRSTYFAFGTRHANVLIHFVGTMAIARLLTPDEIGVFAVAAAIVAVSQILRDFGVGSYLIQSKQLDAPHIRSALGVGLLIGCGLALLLCLLAKPIADFYRQPGVATVLYILSVSFVLMPVQAVGLALLRRNLQFGTLFWFENVSSAAWAATAIAMAAFGFGYRSLAWSSLAQGLTMLVLFLAIRRELVLHRPSLARWRDVAGFGSQITIANVITQLGQLAPALAMGRLLGFGAVAFYNRANSVTRMFRDTCERGARSIALPAFAQQRRDGTFDKQAYLHATTLITGISWPFFCGLALTAYPLVRILFGDQWDAAVPALRLLAVSNLITALFVLSGEALIATGAVSCVLRRALIIQSFRIILVVGCALYSLYAVAAAQIVVNVLAVAVNLHYLNRVIGLNFGDLVRTSRPSAGVTAFSIIGPGLVALVWPAAPGFLWPPLLLAVATGGIGWIGGVWAFGHPIREEIVILIRKTRSLVPVPRGAQAANSTEEA